jgi:hypothetical protein
VPGIASARVVPVLDAVAVAVDAVEPPSCREELARSTRAREVLAGPNARRVEAAEIALDRIDPGDHAPVQPIPVPRLADPLQVVARDVCQRDRRWRVPRSCSRPARVRWRQPPINVATSSTSSSPSSAIAAAPAAIRRRATRGWTTTDTRVSRGPLSRSSGGRRGARRAGCGTAAGRPRPQPRRRRSNRRSRPRHAPRSAADEPGRRSPALAAATPPTHAAARSLPLESVAPERGRSCTADSPRGTREPRRPPPAPRGARRQARSSLRLRLAWRSLATAWAKAPATQAERSLARG